MLKEIYAEAGVRGLFKGVQQRVGYLGLNNAIFFNVYEFARGSVPPPPPQSISWPLSDRDASAVSVHVSGPVSGVCARGTWCNNTYLHTVMSFHVSGLRC